MGQSPSVCLFEPPAPRYHFLKWSNGLRVEENPVAMAPADALIILDTCSRKQLEPAARLLADSPRTLVIDHHATVDDIATGPRDLRIIDPSAGACCLLLHEWLLAANISCDPATAAALFTGIATDSGWFRFSNADERLLRAAAELTARGARPSNIHADLFQHDPLGRLRLAGCVLSSLELHADGLLAVMGLRDSDFARVGADRSMTEDLVNQAGSLEGIEAFVLFTEEPDCIRANFRSRTWLDVAALAAEFGGGGHARAAGARLPRDWEAQTRRVIARLTERLSQGTPNV